MLIKIRSILLSDMIILNHFKYLKRDITSILFLEKSLQLTTDKFRSSHKRSIKKAENDGVIIRQSEDFISFYRILEKNRSIHVVGPSGTALLQYYGTNLLKYL